MTRKGPHGLLCGPFRTEGAGQLRYMPGPGRDPLHEKTQPLVHRVPGLAGEAVQRGGGREGEPFEAPLHVLHTLPYGPFKTLMQTEPRAGHRRGLQLEPAEPSGTRSSRSAGGSRRAPTR
jgi:hypothetical protein